MKVNYFDINIIDTEVNALVVSLEKTALASPTVIYNGADNLHQTIMTSEMQFSFLVSQLNSTAYNHLFTGSEVRYKVELVDDSVYNYPKTIWCGYLLPEQFNEPYKAKDYFIEFTATDGVALLKDKEFSVTIDVTTSTKISILDTINQCLLQTGLTLPIRFAKAIDSAVFELDYLEFETDILAYKEDKAYQDAFTVLENCLKSLGCKLFQFEGFWYVTGLNHQKETIVVYKHYEYNTVSFNLEYVKDVTVIKEVVSAPILEGANVSLLPPFKKITATWAAEFQDNLLPEDVVKKETTAALEALWRKESTKDFRLSSYYKELIFSDAEEDLLAKYKNGEITKPTGAFDVDKVAEGPFLSLAYDGGASVFGGTETISSADSFFNYITLKKPLFINGKTGGNISASLNLNLKTIGYNLFTGTATPAVVNATVVGGFNIWVDRQITAQVKFNAVNHGLVNNTLISIENEVDGSGNVINDYYTGVYNIRSIDADHFSVAKDYDANYIYTAKCVELKDFTDIEQVEQSLKDYFAIKGEFAGIDDSDPNLLPIVDSDSNGLTAGDYINIITKDGFGKRVFDGVQIAVGINANQFQLNFHKGGQSYSGEWEILPFKANFYYELIKHREIDNEVTAKQVISNYESTGEVKGLYDFDVSQDGLSVKCSLNIEDIVIDEDAYYNIRIRPVVTNDLLSNQVVCTDLEFNLNNQTDVNSVLKRGINFTASLDLDNFHSCSKLENTIRNFYFSDALKASFLAGTIAFNSYVASEDLFVISGSDKEVVLNVEDTAKVVAGFEMYKRNIDGSGSAVLVSGYISTDDADYGVVYTNSLKLAAVTITTSEELLLELPTALTSENQCAMFKDLFARSKVSESISWQDCLVKLHHDLYQATSVLFTGEITDLVGPLDMVALSYNQETKNCTPTNLVLNLSEGKTQVTIVENQSNLVSDYV